MKKCFSLFETFVLVINNLKNRYFFIHKELGEESLMGAKRRSPRSSNRL